MKLGENREDRQYHIALARGEIGGYAILPGDPGRVKKIAELLDDPEFIAENREFRTFSGTLSGERVCVTSTGIGGPSSAIAMEELTRCGVHTFIRAGTCGGMQPEVRAGDLVIVSAAIRGDGTSREYLPDGYPAAADFTVLSALRGAAVALGTRYHIGVVQSKDSFYGQTEPESMPMREFLNARWQSYVRAGCLASEMEAATLLSVGLARRVRVGAVLTAVWNPELVNSGQDASQNFDSENAIRCAIEAMRLLIAADRKG